MSRTKCGSLTLRRRLNCWRRYRCWRRNCSRGIGSQNWSCITWRRDWLDCIGWTCNRWMIVSKRLIWIFRIMSGSWRNLSKRRIKIWVTPLKGLRSVRLTWNKLFRKRIRKYHNSKRNWDIHQTLTQRKLTTCTPVFTKSQPKRDNSPQSISPHFLSLTPKSPNLPVPINSRINKLKNYIWKYRRLKKIPVNMWKIWRKSGEWRGKKERKKGWENDK